MQLWYFALICCVIGVVWSQPCFDDSYEPNNAVPYVLNSLPVLLSNLTLCNVSDTFDIFRWTANAAGVVQAIVINETLGGGIDLEIDVNGAFGAEDTFTGSAFPTRVAMSVSSNDIVDIGTYGYASSPYGMSITLLPPCVNDRFEPNPSFVSATPITITSSYSLLNLVICPGDADIYRFVIQGGPGALDISVFYSGLYTDLDFTVYDFTQTIVLDSYSVLNPETGSVLLQAGTYYLRVYQYEDNWYGSYNISIAATLTEVTTGAAEQSGNQSNEVTTTSSKFTYIGIGIGGFVFLVLVLGITVFCIVTKRKPKKQEEQMSVIVVNSDGTTAVPIQVQTTGPSGQRIVYAHGLGTPNGSAQQNPFGQPAQSNAPVAQEYKALGQFQAPDAKLEKAFDIDYNELEGLTEIGRGSFGVVYRAKWREIPVAVKQLLAYGLDDPKALADFRGEAEILKNLRSHPNVVLFIGITSPPQPMCVITEFCQNGSLNRFLKSDAKMDSTLQFKLLRQTALGLLHLHSEKIIHRDLAARNLLLTENFDVKVSDFGLSRVSNNDAQKTKSDIGPLKWMSPEAIRKKIYSQKSDVWSFGVVIWEVVTRQDPFPDMDAVEAAMAVVHENLRLKIPESCDPILAKLMRDCWQIDPEARPTFKAICGIIGNSDSMSSPPPVREDPQDYNNIRGSPGHSNQSAKYQPTEYGRMDNLQTQKNNLNTEPNVFGGATNYGQVASVNSNNLNNYGPLSGVKK